MANPAPTINQINAFNATQGTTIDFNIIGGTELVRSNRIYIYDLSDNSLICTHLYVSTESIHELPPNTDSSIVYESGKSSADFVNGAQYYAQIQTFTDTAGTQGGSGLSVAKMFWCLNNPTLTINTIPSTISTTSYNVSATYNANTSVVSNIIQQYQFSLYSATGSLLQSSGVIVGSGEQQGTSTAYDISYNFTGLSVGSSYYVVVDVTTTQGMSVSAQSSTFTVSIDTPTLGEATVVNNACDGYISVISNLSSEYGGSGSGDIVSFETDSENVFTKLQVDLEPLQDLHGYDSPWVGGAGKNKLPISCESATKGGVTYTVYKNSSGAVTRIHAEGTSTSAHSFSVVQDRSASNPFTIKAGSYWFKGLSNGVSGSFDFNIRKVGATTDIVQITNKVPLVLEEDTGFQSCYLYVYNGKTLNLDIYPMVWSQSESSDDFEPYSNICPISGRTECVTYDDPKYGGTIEWNQLAKELIASNWILQSPNSMASKSISDGKLTFSVGSTASNWVGIAQTNIAVVGHKYLQSCYLTAPKATRFKSTGSAAGVSNYSEANKRTLCQTVFTTASSTIHFYIACAEAGLEQGDTVVVESPQYFDLTAMFGEGNEPTTVEEFRTLFPKDYYEYNVGEETCVSAANGDEYRQYTTTLGRTVYGGTLDVVSGELVVDRAMVTLDGVTNRRKFNGSFGVTNNGYSVYWNDGIPRDSNAISDRFVASRFGVDDMPLGSFVGDSGVIDTWTFILPSSITSKDEANAWLTENPTTIVYELATPLTYQLTPKQIQTLVGTNNVWSEQGDVELAYHISITDLLVKRQDVDDVSGNWLTLYSQPVEQASDMDFTFIDFLNQYGKTYKYALVPLLTQTQSGVEVEVEGGYTVSDEVQSIFDGVFISDSTGSQKCKANVGYGNVNMNQSVGSITPIGSQYPIIVTNSNNRYHNGSISGMIVPDDYYYNGNLSRIDMVNKRNELEQFLTNKRAKIIKDWNSNIWLVMIMDNIDCSFDNNYGMGIVTFNANWLEIGDPTNQGDLQATGLVDVGGV